MADGSHMDNFHCSECNMGGDLLRLEHGPFPCPWCGEIVKAELLYHVLRFDMLGWVKVIIELQETDDIGRRVRVLGDVYTKDVDALISRYTDKGFIVVLDASGQMIRLAYSE